MNGTVEDVEAQRARWERYRSRQKLTLDDDGADFATGGLGGCARELAFRLLILPTDPEAGAVPLDREALTWIKGPRESPYGGNYPSWGSSERGAHDAVVIYDQYRENEGWDRYLALHRHGGIEIGARSVTYQLRQQFDRPQRRAFLLRSIVGLAWTAAALEAEVIGRWEIAGPFEITVALRDTNGATLANFGEGWQEPDQAFGEYATCLDQHVLLREELDHLADLEDFALGLGQRIELAFGSVNQRYLGRRGEYEGRFDPRVQL